MIDADYPLTEVLYETPEIIVTRRMHAQDGLPVVVKQLRNPENSQRLARLQFEYALAQKFAAAKVPGVLQALRWHRSHAQVMLVAADVGGYSLREHHRRQLLSLAEILTVGAQVCDALSGVHRAGVTHNDVNPGNVVVNRHTGVVQLIDFEIASELSRESASLEAFRGFHGTPAYASPEQTGRLNRAVDWRTDLYSLGASLYELVAGRLPFEGDLDALTYAILAREPTPLVELNPQCPPQLVAVIARLMAKSQELRYQSAQGARDDLLRCAELWRAQGRVAVFDLGQSDRCERFELPQRLYGRAPQVAQLAAAYDRAAAGTCEVVWLAGPSGIGKSALVREVQARMAEHGAVLLSGKYDQLRQHAPFNAFTAAVGAFVRRVLQEPPKVIDGWKLVLGGALGNIGQALLDVAPALSSLVGPQKALHDGGAQANENRLLLALQRFITALGTRQPLVLFLDDLQWADAGTYKLLKNLMQGAAPARGLLLVGAYRDNEVSAEHPLRHVLGLALSPGGTVPMQTLEVAPLVDEDIRALIGDATRSPAADAAVLAALVRQKTHGNPFFVREFLHTLARRGLLSYDPAGNRWSWDAAAVRAANVTDNVVQLMRDRLVALTPAEQRALSYAAALGCEFTLADLALVLGVAPPACAEWLVAPLQLGLIEAQEDSYRYATQGAQQVRYRFPHDQLQHAAYALLDAASATRCHYEIGEALLGILPMAEASSWVLRVLGHLQRGAPLMDAAQRRRAVQLNHLGALEAKRVAAYGIAVEALRQAIRLLGDAAPERLWQDERALAWALHLELGNCCLLANEAEAAAQAHGLALQWASSALETARAHRSRCEALSAMGQTAAAIEVGLLGLRALGVQVRADAGLPGLLRALVALKVALIGRPIEDLVTLPPVTDPRIEEVMALFTTLAMAVYFINPILFATMSLLRARLSLRHGMSAGTPHAIAMVGVVYCQVGDYALGRRYARAALAAAARLPYVENAPSLQVVHDLICAHTQLPPSAVSESCATHALLTLEAGSPSEAWAIAVSAVIGDCLSAPQVAKERVDTFIQRLPVSGAQERSWVAILRQAPRCLLGETPSLLTWSDSAAEDAAFEASLQDPATGLATMTYATLRTVTLWLGRALDEAAAMALRADKAGALEKAGDQSIALFATFALLALSDKARQSGRWRFTREERSLMRRSWRKLRQLAADAPSVYGGVALWMRAQEAATRGQAHRARQLYTRATRLLDASGYACFAAAANECAGRFHAQQQDAGAARGYLAAAVEAYAMWGVHPKPLLLRKEFPRWLHGAGITSTNTSTARTERGAPLTLDLPAVLEVTQALGGEASEQGLIDRVMQTLLARTGATRGVFVTCDRAGMHLTHDTAPDALGIPLQLMEFVRRDGGMLLLEDPSQAAELPRDSYLAASQPRSILCVPVTRQTQTLAVFYFENRLVAHAFNDGHGVLVRVLAAQMAVSLESARLNAHLESEISARTRELQAMHAHMLQLQAAATASQLAGGFAHEMRNALSPAAMSLGLLQLDPEFGLSAAPALLTQATPPTAADPALQALDWAREHHTLERDALPQAAAGVARALRITGEIFAYASVAQEHAGDERVSADAAIARLHTAFRPRLEAHTIRFTAEGTDAVVLAMKQEHIDTVLTHLMANACDALEQAAERHIAVRTAVEAGAVHIRIADSGAGMSAEARQRLFEPFFTTKGTRGAGLGLGLCQRILTLYGGSLQVEGAAGQGTVVHIEVPVR